MEQLNDAGPTGIIAQLGQMLDDVLSDNYIFTATTLWHYWEGLVITVQLVFLSLIIGLVLAVPLAILRGSRRRWIKMPVYLYTYVFSGTPLLIQLYLIYYGVVFFDGFDIWLGITSVHVPSIQDTWLSGVLPVTPSSRRCWPSCSIPRPIPPRSSMVPSSPRPRARWKLHAPMACRGRGHVIQHHSAQCLPTCTAGLRQ